MFILRKMGGKMASGEDAAATPFSDTLSPASWFSHVTSGVKYRLTVPVMNGDV